MEDAGDWDFAMPSTSSILPALPQNGTMKTYENPSRTFTRPYSAKTCYFYKEGDLFFTVRRITTPMGRTNIDGLDQLVHLGKYVASSSNPPKGVDLDKIQEKNSAAKTRHPNKTNGGQAYWVLFVLNGKGKFYKTLINPMKMPTMEQLLTECSTHLEIAIHRFYTPEGVLITTVEEILATNSPRIIACPRHERPILVSNANGRDVHLPEIHPSKFAPRLPYHRPDYKSSSTGGSGGIDTSGNSSGNSIEKRERLPPVQHSRYVPRKRQQLQNSDAYAPKSFSTEKPERYNRRTVPIGTNIVKTTVVEQRKTMDKMAEKGGEKGTEKSSATSLNGNWKDSGTGNSISSSRQSERAESMTERKAQMIRDELRANLNQQSGSDHYSEEDRILEEDSDFDNVVAGGIESGTDEEREKADSALGSTQKHSPLTRGSTHSHRTPARRTPSTSSSDREPARSTRSKRLSRQETPAAQTPPSTSGSAGSGSSRPKSTYSSRPPTGSQIAEEENGREGSESSEEEADEDVPETPAIHTPDTRMSTGNSLRTIVSGSSNAWSRISQFSDKEVQLPSDDEEADLSPRERERRNQAARVVQRTMRRVKFERDKEEKKRARIAYEASMISYTVDVHIGSRFNVDFDTRLFVVLHAANGEKSEKIWSEEPNYLFNENNYSENDGYHLIFNKRTRHLGVLTSLEVGHEQQGYGAGTYISRITVSEDTVDGCLFLFHVEKWFDSGQVDGLIERTIATTSFRYQTSLMKERKPTAGRWSFRLYSKQGELGGTTSSIIVVAYGTQSSIHYELPRSRLLMTTDGALIQLEFGTDIGYLRKVRFELVPYGDQPDYYLEYVEMEDVDTKEKCTVFVNGWLHSGAAPGYRKWQGFREMALFLDNNYTVPSTKTYEGTVKLADRSLCVDEKDPQIFLQFFHSSSEKDEIKEDASGLVPVVPVKMKNGNINYTYKIEYVTTSTAPNIRVIPQHITQLGKDILDGLDLLKWMYSSLVYRQVIGGEMKVGAELFIEEIHHKNGDHIPFSMIYRNSNIEYERNHDQGPFFKQMTASSSPATSTMRKWKKSDLRSVETDATWHLYMSLRHPYEILPHSDPMMPPVRVKLSAAVAIPTVTLVAKDHRTFEMDCQQERPEKYEEGMLLKYTLSCPNFGNPAKVRVSLDFAKSEFYTHVWKMKLHEVNTGTHVFLNLDEPIYELETKELLCGYPDIGNYSLLSEYELHIRTVEGDSSNFRPFIKLIGEDGDTGYRPHPGIIDFRANTVFEMVITASDMKRLQSIEVWAKIGTPKNWKGSIRIVSTEMKGSKKEVRCVYQSGLLELSKNGQIAMGPLQFLGHDDPMEEGESKMVKAVVGFGAACGVSAIVACLWAALVITNDINDMYDDVMGELGGFRDISDETWGTMLDVRRGSGESAEEYVRGIFGRHKRSNSQCSCGLPSQGCPAGAPGNPGAPGEPGGTGPDGKNGPPGLPGLNIPIPNDFPKECIKCPAGPPGPDGLPGQEGFQGLPGDAGKRGTPGKDGEPGRVGDIGDEGHPGQDGQPGLAGPPGRDGLTGKGLPGVAGRPGLPGARGEPGNNGNPGEEGAPGAQGPTGQPGKDGFNGNDGTPGQAGPQGAVGADAEYCPCPERKRRRL
ncbi:unnamed protein product [Caenorhabditis sp. 36 PRJEB53466]|nr:unnamed protein product [Caenorhabditis sp. 36 PRJEB53466]